MIMPESARAAATEAPADNLPPETPEARVTRLRAEIKAARAEVAKPRTEARAVAAAEAREAYARDVLTAAGVAPVDGADVLEQLTAHLAETRTAASATRAELALLKAAKAAGADLKALADSTSFGRRLEGIDMTDEQAVSVAVNEALAAQPHLAIAAPPRPRMRPNPAQGGSSNAPTRMSGVKGRAAMAEQYGTLHDAMRAKAAWSAHPDDPLDRY